ncbi:ATP-dependent Clp protease ATP-binding subunit [Ruminococcaceae bacterium OttesenSCG-928-L11]|nr:ATP-dependent Clp protease ATP-binding subunit [Ruminococcaceae bacterium OttesenSCG-928-L11]
MLCSRCRKRMAVLFLAHMENGEMKDKGLCLKCARELNIPQVKEVMDKLGLSDEEIETMSDQMTDLMGGEANLDGDFEVGGAQPLPFLQNLFNGAGKDDTNKLQPVNSSDAGKSERTRDDSAKDKAKREQRRKRKFLDNFCENLTEKAKNGKIDHIVGRDNEIYRVIQILNRRTKNNPCLIGEPGVGKTAIAEGIAIRLADGNVPPRLADKELFLLDLTALVAGTQFRGQFESRVKGLVNEIKEAGNIILFIDEVHNIVGAGDSEGSMNTANILKPALSRGEIQVIGATTFTEYRKYIEKDAALERRFQPVKVEEPSISDTIEVLRGVKGYYEKFHRVVVPDTIVTNCVVLSERYITDRFLPDKAIDLLDEACSCATLKNASLSEYDTLNTELRELIIEEEQMEADPMDIDYQRVAEIKAEKIRITDRLKEIEPQALGVQVTTEDLARVLELWTGIPASKIRESELRKVANLANVMKSKIIGQDEAVELVAAAVRRSRVQISGRRRPASFIFVGPTGVGKTELVKVLSQELFDAADPLIRLDMSEFMEKHSVSRIIGSPPGYVGYDEAGQLTEKVRRKPYSVVLFDEIEKAHPDVMNILLQILDEGKITDAQGRVVNFENTVIVMTSNAGSNLKNTSLGFNKQTQQIEKDKAMKALNEFLRPEFIGRVDEVVVFRALDQTDYEKIANLMLTELVAPLGEKDIEISWDDSALAWIAAEAHGNKSGARDLRRVIRKNVEDRICNMLVDHPERVPTSINVTCLEGGLSLLTLYAGELERVSEK